MRAFLVAVAVMIVVAVAADFTLASLDLSSEAVYQTSNVRTDEAAAE